MSAIPRLRPLLRASSPQLRNALANPAARFHAISARLSDTMPQRTPDIPFLPRFMQPTTYFPSYGQPKPDALTPARPKPTDARKQWNPATFFIVCTSLSWAQTIGAALTAAGRQVIFLLIGSQGIQQLALKQQHVEFMRKADNRIDALREVIDRLGKGEDVDIEKMLGTGDEREEMAWEDVIKEIENDDVLWQARKLQKETAEKAAQEAEDKPKSNAKRAERRKRAQSASDYI